MKCKIVLHRSEEGFSIACPGLPGGLSQGATEQEALANITIAIQEYMAARDEIASGQEVREVEVGV
jgi:predicted RNase H-like HicB family nuclease